MTHSLLCLAGDGIGPEIMAATKAVVEAAGAKSGKPLRLTDMDIGFAALHAERSTIPEPVIEAARAADGVILGPVSHNDYPSVMEGGLNPSGVLRKELDLFANLRPAIVFDALVDASTLKPEIVKGLDILIVRELTSGVYFGEPRGIEDLGNGERRGFNTQTYTTSEIRRIGKVAFELARKRDNRVISAEKANVMESGKLWREEMTTLHEEFSDVELEHMYADNCAMQLCRNPRQFDVIVTDNLFGDILSDEAAMLTGSLGMLPSASLGAEGVAGLYEPVHGSAPDIAGQGKANPLATILSLAMLLRYSFDRGDLADLIEISVQDVLNANIRTADIVAEGSREVSTAEMGDALIDALSEQYKQAA